MLGFIIYQTAIHDMISRLMANIRAHIVFEWAVGGGWDEQKKKSCTGEHSVLAIGSMKSSEFECEYSQNWVMSAVYRKSE